MAVFFLGHAFGATEQVWEFDELRAVTEMAVAAAVTVTRRDGGCTECAAMVAAFKGEHQAFTTSVVADDFE